MSGGGIDRERLVLLTKGVWVARGAVLSIACYRTETERRWFGGTRILPPRVVMRVRGDRAFQWSFPDDATASFAADVMAAAVMDIDHPAGDPDDPERVDGPSPSGNVVELADRRMGGNGAA